MRNNRTKKSYIGERYDAETGLMYLNARYYDPTFGRYVPKDDHAVDIGAPEDGHSPATPVAGEARLSLSEQIDDAPLAAHRQGGNHAALLFIFRHVPYPLHTERPPCTRSQASGIC